MKENLLSGIHWLFRGNFGMARLQFKFALRKLQPGRRLEMQMCEYGRNVDQARKTARFAAAYSASGFHPKARLDLGPINESDAYEMIEAMKENYPAFAAFAGKYVIREGENAVALPFQRDEDHTLVYCDRCHMLGGRNPCWGCVPDLNHDYTAMLFELSDGAGILITTWGDGTVTAAYRRNRYDTWGPPVGGRKVD